MLPRDFSDGTAVITTRSTTSYNFDVGEIFSVLPPMETAHYLNFKLLVDDMMTQVHIFQTTLQKRC